MNGSIAAETADPAGNGEDPVLEESHLQREALARGAGAGLGLGLNGAAPAGEDEPAPGAEGSDPGWPGRARRMGSGAGGVASGRRSACAGSGCSGGLRMH